MSMFAVTPATGIAMVARAPAPLAEGANRRFRDAIAESQQQVAALVERNRTAANAEFRAAVANAPSNATPRIDTWA